MTVSVIGEFLFYNSNHAGIDDAIRAQEPKLREMVDRLPDRDFDSQSDDELTARIVEEARFDPLVVDFEGATKNVRETTTEVRDSFGWDRETVQVPAFEVTKTIPFTGDANIWRLMTGQWSTSMPRGEVRGKTLIVGITVPTQRAEEAKAYLDSTIDEIKEYVPRQKALIDAYNDSLPARVAPLVAARRSRRSAAADLLAKL
jgi:hypothetical protein